jgi:hypothetical protein
MSAHAELVYALLEGRMPYESGIEEEVANDLPVDNGGEAGGVDTGPNTNRPHVNSVDFFLENADKPIFDGARMTVVRAAYTDLQWKVDHVVRDGAFDKLLKLMRAAMPESHCFPGCVLLLTDLY